MRRVRAIAIGLAMGSMALMGIAQSAHAGQGDNALISRQSKGAGGQGADASSEAPSISATGRFLALQTSAQNLGGPISPFIDNVYVYNQKRKRIQLVSRQSKSAGGAGGNAGSYVPSISAEARFVAFETDATNLGGPDVAGRDVYVYDRTRKRVRLVSRPSKAVGGGPDAASFAPSISASGRFVAFDTFATNLGGPQGPGRDVYVYDRKRKRAQLVSRQSKVAGGAGSDSGDSAPAISADGRFVAFESFANNLGGPVDTTVVNIYLYDRKRKRVQLVSRQSPDDGGQGADADSEAASISADGRYVAFRSSATNLSGLTQTQTNIYVYDRKAKRVELVSRQSQDAGGQGADQTSMGSMISGSGRYVAFDTGATNLGGPQQAPVDVYVYDRELEQVQLASRASEEAGGAGGDQASFAPAISASGRFVSFETDANNFGGPLVSTVLNIYRHDLLGP
jgi:Tol biopolymer transport system component